MSAQAKKQQEARHVSLLEAVPFLADVPRDELEGLVRAAVVRHFEPGETIVVQGQFGHSMFVLAEGTLSVRARAEDGSGLDLGTLGRGDFFGEVALLGRGERSATVTATSQVEVLEIEKNRFEIVARRHESALESLEKFYHARAIATYTRLHRYLGELPSETLRELTQDATMRKFSRDDVVCRAGEAAESVMLIKDGVLKMVRTGDDGRLSILAYFNTHDIAGAHDGEKRKYDLIALGQAEIIFLPRKAFRALEDTHPHVFARFGKDDMHRQSALASAGKTVFGAAQAFLQEGVEVESLLVINLDRCVRCGNCVRACHARHSFTRLDRRGPIFRRRKAVHSQSHEHLLVPSSCRHCRDPECMIGCPTGAIQRFPGGDVDINDNCIGCDNCARKCPYGNITMRPLSEDEPAPEGVTKRAIKCNLCRGHSYSNCVHECPRGAVLRVDPLRYFDELALVMEPEQVDAIEWQRIQAEKAGQLDTKQQVRPRSTRFIFASLGLFCLAIAGLVSFYVSTDTPRTGGTVGGLIFGGVATGCIAFAMFLGARKRMRDAGLGRLEVWTQFHMVIGALGFFAALAHAGFRITGVFAALLLAIFALEVFTGVLGQAIYMVVPRILTRLERNGLARLIEDLIEEEQALEQGIGELLDMSPPEVARLARGPIWRGAGGHLTRCGPGYDSEARVEQLLASLDMGELSPKHRATVGRLAADVHRLKDVRTQLLLHRSLKYWLVLHIASAAALGVFVLSHIVAMVLFL